MVRSDGHRRVFRRHVAMLTDHGSWVLLASPLLIGPAAGGRLDTPTIYLVVASICGFLVRQPTTIAVRIASGRRSPEDLAAALSRIALYSLVGLAHVTGLVVRGFYFVLYLAVPAIPVFAWYPVLVARRAERRQMLLEILAFDALA